MIDVIEAFAARDYARGSKALQKAVKCSHDNGAAARSPDGANHADGFISPAARSVNVKARIDSAAAVWDRSPEDGEISFR